MANKLNTIKIRVDDDQQYRIRFAAARRSVSMAEFAREAVLRETERLLKDVKVPKPVSDKEH